MDEFKVLFGVLESLKNKLDNSESPREIIFESWFVFDYYIRRMLLNGLDIEDFENKELDLMYDLLPQSFDSCLKIFEKFLKNQRDIFEKKMHPNAFLKFYESDIGFKGGFIAYLMNEKKDLFDSFFNVYWGYINKAEPDYFVNYNNWDYSKYSIYKVAKKTWLESCVNIDDEWFKIVRKLNNSRNKAAHLYDETYIYAVFGINGENRLEKLKNTLIELIKNTLKFELKN